MHIAVLGSTRGSLLAPLVDGLKSNLPDMKVVCVISNKEHSGILAKAESMNIPAIFCPVAGMEREQYDQGLSEVLQSYQADWVVLLGYMRILSASFVSQWQHRIINTHPSLLPAHAGLMDLAVHQAVLDAGDKESGCSVHLVTEALDAGPVLLQKKCPVLPDDNAETLKNRVQNLEVAALLDALTEISRKK